MDDFLGLENYLEGSHCEVSSPHMSKTLICSFLEDLTL